MFQNWVDLAALVAKKSLSLPFLPCAAESSVALLGEERDRKTSSSGSRKERRENNGPAEGAFVIPLSLNSLILYRKTSWPTYLLMCPD